MTADKGDEPQGMTDAELDALMASTDRDLLAVIKGSVDLDAGMRDLYRRLHEESLPGDPGEGERALARLNEPGSRGSSPTPASPRSR
jgi:hypothetical protein